MNNKIKVSSFFNAKGLVEVRLIKETRYMDKDLYNKPIIFYANSNESFKKLHNDLLLYEMYYRIPIIVENISICLNGIIYDYNKELGFIKTFLNPNNYLYAKGKYYKGATI